MEDSIIIFLRILVIKNKNIKFFSFVFQIYSCFFLPTKVSIPLLAPPIFKKYSLTAKGSKSLLKILALGLNLFGSITNS